MSIYVVRLSEWFPKGDPQHDNMKMMVGFTPCLHCGKKKMHWQDAVGHHSVPWGHGDVYCREKCHKNSFKTPKIHKQNLGLFCTAIDVESKTFLYENKRG